MFQKKGLIIIICLITLGASAQDTLPKFTLLNKGGNRIITSWTNTYGSNIKQLSIQRSFDSTRNFKTIMTLPDPTVPQNGYVDTKATNDHMFYRLYILLDSGNYIFSASKRPKPDSLKAKPIVKEVNKDTKVAEEPKPENKNVVTNPPPKEILKQEPKTESKPEVKEPIKPKEIPERILYIKRRDTLIGQIGERSYKRFRDSMQVHSKDTLGFNTTDTLVIKPFVPKEVWKPSKYVFTEKDGNVKISLPDAAAKKYSLKFFEQDSSPLFEVKQIRDSVLILDKTNFVHSGWFKFELYEDGQLKEKQKLFIPKEF